MGLGFGVKGLGAEGLVIGTRAQGLKLSGVGFGVSCFRLQTSSYIVRWCNKRWCSDKSNAECTGRYH